MSVRPPFDEYLHQLWDRRHFIQMHAFSQALGQHTGTLLGRAWLIVGPLLDGAVYWLIFGVVFGANRGVPDFVPRLLIGILLFSYVSRCLTTMANSVNGGSGLIRAFSFPRASLPIAALIKESISAVPMLVTLLCLIVFVPPHATPSSTWLLIPFPLMLIAGFAAGVGFTLARVVSVVPDLGKLIGYGMRFLLYGSGVIFGIERFGEHAVLTSVLQANPVYIFLEMMRDLLLYSSIPTPSNWFQLIGWSLIALVTGLIYFWRGEATYGKQRTA